jgi:membrane protein DedA with SNARE-associated domain
MFDWITGFVENSGYLGIALLMFAENVFPPIPSELIMPLAGFAAARGDLDVIGVILSGSAGSIAGALLWYRIGRWLGLGKLRSLADRNGRWLTLSPEDLDQAQGFFERHSATAVLIGRLVPGVRTLISVPAGIVAMPLAKFLFFSAIGTIIWTAILALAGYLLQGQHAKVAGWLGPVTNLVTFALLAWYFYRVATFKQSRDRS